MIGQLTSTISSSQTLKGMALTQKVTQLGKLKDKLVQLFAQQ